MMKLAERSEALSMLDALFDECLSGVSNVVVVDGSVGSGKTSVLRAIVERAGKEGAHVLSATASRAEISISLGVVDQLLYGIQFPTPAVERLTRLLAENNSGLARRTGYRDAEQVSVSVLRTMCTAIRNLSESQPVVIAVDDAHFIDPASLQCLLHLIRRLKSDRVLVAFFVSFQSPLVRCLFDAEVLRLPNCHGIVLSPLSEQGVAAVLAEQLDQCTALALARDCHHFSGGSPLLVSALADDYLAAGAKQPPEAVVGDAFGRAVLSCLYRAEPGLLEVTQAIVMLGESVSPPLLARLLEMPPETVVQTLDELDAAGLLRAARCCQERARAAVLDGMPSDQRRAMHHRAARLLDKSGAPSTTVAEHIVATEDAEPWTVEVLREAAGQMLGEGRIDTAVSYLQLAHQACADDQERALTISALNGAVWLVNPRATKRHLPELTAAIRAGNLNGSHGALTVGQLLWHGHTTEAHDLLTILDCGEGRSPRQTDGFGGLDGMRLWLPYVYPGLSPDLSPERRPAATAWKYPLTSTWAPHLRATSALNMTLTGAVDANVVAEAEQVLRGVGQSDGVLAPVLAALAVLFYADRLDKAISWCDSLPVDVGADQGVVSNALLGLIRSAIRYRQGDLAEAEVRGKQALAMLTPAGWGAAVAAPLAFLVLTATAMGKYGEAGEYLKVPVPSAAFETLGGLHYLNARGRYSLASGAIDAALHDFEACGELVTRWNFDSPSFVPWRTDIAEAHLCRKSDRAPAGLVSKQLTLLRPGRSRTRGVTLQVQAAMLELPQRIPLLHEAVDNFRFCGDRLSQAYALAGLGRAYQAMGKYRLAEGMTRRASRLAERCGAEPLVQSLAPILAGLDDGGAVGEPPPLAVLSDAERKVAVEAAEGFTNRQIASRLYITVSTVEQHLTKVYRKLAVNHRSELRPWLRSDIVVPARRSRWGAVPRTDKS
jgi:DNA-binding CsgD family transcriptional regulator